MRRVNFGRVGYGDDPIMLEESTINLELATQLKNSLTYAAKNQPSMSLVMHENDVDEVGRRITSSFRKVKTGKRVSFATGIFVSLRFNTK